MASKPTHTIGAMLLVSACALVLVIAAIFRAVTR